MKLGPELSWIVQQVDNDDVAVGQAAIGAFGGQVKRLMLQPGGSSNVHFPSIQKALERALKGIDCPRQLRAKQASSHAEHIDQLLSDCIQVMTNDARTVLDKRRTELRITALLLEACFENADRSLGGSTSEGLAREALEHHRLKTAVAKCER
jgi:hypothetical protein